MCNNILNSTYLGHIKRNLKGGIKIINDSEDKNILKKRNYILNDLSNVFNGGKELMYEDIPYYVQALEGKYLRNKICKGGSPQCKDACNLVKKSYKKLIKQSINEFNKTDLYSILKDGSPLLYKKIKGGNKYDAKSNNKDGSYDKQTGGTNLDYLRYEINQIRGGDALEMLRNEINQIRSSQLGSDTDL